MVSVRGIAWFVVWWLSLLAAATGGEPLLPDSRTPVTVAIMPSLEATAPQEVAVAAETVADLLAIELAGDGQVRVVDRTQIDRLLEERAISDVNEPILAYDVLVGVRIEWRVANPTVILRVVDLSLGNLAGIHEWPWNGAPSADRLREMARACKESSLSTLATSRGRLKVRLLGAGVPGGVYQQQRARARSAQRRGVATSSSVDRLDSMANHLGLMMEQVAARVPGVCVVRHLEAVSSKEESLLLLLGQARLAEGRAFAPQADRLLSVELTAKDAKESPLEDDTVLEIRLRLSPDGQHGDWTRVQGTMGDWSQLASQACQLLVQQLGQTGPATTGEYVSEMILRRRQAEAELAAAKGTLPRDYREFDRERIAAAMKLDPTYEEAAYTYVYSFVQYHAIMPLESAPEAFRYLERFHEERLPERLPWGAAPRNAPERRVVRQRQHRRRVLTTLTTIRSDRPPTNAQELEVVRKIVELGMGEDIHEFCPNCGWVVEQMYRGWKASGVDPEGLRLWRKELRRRADILTSQMDQVIAPDSRRWVQIGLMRVRSTLVTAAVESGDGKLARQRLKEFIDCEDWIHKDRGLSANARLLPAETLRETIVQMADPGLLAKYDDWLTERGAVHPADGRGPGANPGSD